MSNPLPERTIMTMLQLGVDAIKADTSVLDSILAALPDDVRSKAKDEWSDHHPEVRLGYARADWTLPIFAVTLTSDSTTQDYIGVGEEAFLGDDDEKLGEVLRKRNTGSFTIFVYTNHPDTCEWWYRVLRRICNVGVRYLIANGLEEPVIGGADLAPDPRYTPENLYMRRVTLSVEYLEEWTDQDALWVALNGDAEGFLPSDGSLAVLHTASGGGVVPFDPDLDEDDP